MGKQDTEGGGGGEKKKSGGKKEKVTTAVATDTTKRCKWERAVEWGRDAGDNMVGRCRLTLL